MTEKLNPSEAQRKAMVDKLGEHVQWHRDGVQMAVDEMISAANSIPEGAPVGTIARRPDGAWIAHRYANLKGEGRWNYFRVDYNAPFRSPGDADSWPQIRPDEWPVTKVYSTEEAAEILGVDLTAQQEPERPASEVWQEIAQRWAERRPKPARTPRVLPSLDCEEARDGTVWKAAFSETEHRRGWKFWYVAVEREWHTDSGHGRNELLGPQEFLTDRGPYTEVLS